MNHNHSEEEQPVAQNPLQLVLLPRLKHFDKLIHLLNLCSWKLNSEPHPDGLSNLDSVSSESSKSWCSKQKAWWWFPSEKLMFHWRWWLVLSQYHQPVLISADIQYWHPSNQTHCSTKIRDTHTAIVVSTQVENWSMMNLLLFLASVGYLPELYQHSCVVILHL